MHIYFELNTRQLKQYLLMECSKGTETTHTFTYYTKHLHSHQFKFIGRTIYYVFRFFKTDDFNCV